MAARASHKDSDSRLPPRPSSPRTNSRYESSSPSSSSASFPHSLTLPPPSPCRSRARPSLLRTCSSEPILPVPSLLVSLVPPLV
ncbi:hypothetical protein GW17_00026428 [Ensete ventricosum]|nr:hypothetical protein GW17_00026428 [Ensete ventricosum]